MKKVTFVEALVMIGVAFPAFAAWQCARENVLDEQGNITATDWRCNDTIMEPKALSETIRSINAKIDNKVAAKDSAVEEKARDNARNTARIAELTAEIAELRARKTAMKASGAQE